MGLFSTKTAFRFHKFTSICSEGTPKDDDKNREINIGEFLEKTASKVSSILSDRDTCVKY